MEMVIVNIEVNKRKETTCGFNCPWLKLEKLEKKYEENQCTAFCMLYKDYLRLQINTNGNISLPNSYYKDLGKIITVNKDFDSEVHYLYENEIYASLRYFVERHLNCYDREIEYLGNGTYSLIRKPSNCE